MDARSLFCIRNQIPSRLTLQKEIQSKVRLYQRFGATLAALPESYVLPDELERFLLRRADHDRWILKEDLIDRGKGVYLFGRHDLIPKFLNPQALAQLYICNPLLFRERKFHYRAVVLVVAPPRSQLDSLIGDSTTDKQIYIWNKYYVYLTLSKYSATDFSDHAAHITNMHVQKRVHKEVSKEEISLTFDDLGDELFARRGQSKALVDARTRQVVADTLRPLPLLREDFGGFTILAYDFMLDDDLNVFLLEVNSKPGNLQIRRYKDADILVEEMGQITIDEVHLNTPRTLFNFDLLPSH